MQPTFILRDILFYIIATIIVILYGIIAKFSTIDSIVLLSLYCVLIIIVAIQESINLNYLRKERKKNYSWSINWHGWNLGRLRVLGILNCWGEKPFR